VRAPDRVPGESFFRPRPDSGDRSRREDSGSPEAGEVAGCIRIDAVIGAVRRSTALPQIAVMGREGEILRVHIGAQVRENGGLLGGIWRVTPQADGVGAGAVVVGAKVIVFDPAIGVAIPVVPVKCTRRGKGQGGQRESGGRRQHRLAQPLQHARKLIHSFVPL
jgi:hypothetical protein